MGMRLSMMLWNVIMIATLLFTIWYLMRSRELKQIKNKSKILDRQLKKNNKPSFNKMRAGARSPQERSKVIFLRVMAVILAMGVIYFLKVILSSNDFLMNILISAIYLIFYFWLVYLLNKTKQKELVLIEHKNELIYSEIARLRQQKQLVIKNLRLFYSVMLIIGAILLSAA